MIFVLLSHFRIIITHFVTICRAAMTFYYGKSSTIQDFISFHKEKSRTRKKENPNSRTKILGYDVRETNYQQKTRTPVHGESECRDRQRMQHAEKRKRSRRRFCKHILGKIRLRDYCSSSFTLSLFFAGKPLPIAVLAGFRSGFPFLSPLRPFHISRKTDQPPEFRKFTALSFFRSHHSCSAGRAPQLSAFRQDRREPRSARGHSRHKPGHSRPRRSPA